MGFSKEMAQSMFTYLRTQPVVLCKEKWMICSNFYLPWLDSPTLTLAEFAYEID